MEIKHIVFQESKKCIQPKEIKKRRVTELPKWKVVVADSLDPEHLLNDPVKKSFIHQQIKNKLHSYRYQDIDKDILDNEHMMDLSGVLCKLQECNYTCYYCKSPVLILYENVREPRQWTLERLNNTLGHISGNVEIACLSCNLRRKTMKPERYLMTKNIKTVVKSF
jgi:hypothetical protein